MIKNDNKPKLFEILAKRIPVWRKYVALEKSDGYLCHVCKNHAVPDVSLRIWNFQIKWISNPLQLAQVLACSMRISLTCAFYFT